MGLKVWRNYLGVFAPKVFESIIDLCKRYILGKDAFDTTRRYLDLCIFVIIVLQGKQHIQQVY